jgi:hypothetical protein
VKGVRIVVLVEMGTAGVESGFFVEAVVPAAPGKEGARLSVLVACVGDRSFILYGG